MSRVHHGQAKNIARLFILLTYVLSILHVGKPIPMVARPQNTVPTETVIVQNLRQPAEILIDHWACRTSTRKKRGRFVLCPRIQCRAGPPFPDRSLAPARTGRALRGVWPAYVEQDKATRLFRYRGDMKKEWAVYSADAKQIAQNFAAGINAYLNWLDEHPDKMPSNSRS